MEFLKNQYRQSIAFLRGPLYSDLHNTTIAFFVIWLLCFVVCLFCPSVLEMLMNYIQGVVDSSNIVGEDGSFSALRILGNNLRASGLSILYGIIPFLYLPALPIGINAAVLGALTASYMVGGRSMMLLAAGLVPHGIFEIPALLIAFACGLYLCRGMGALIRGKPESPQLGELFLSLLRVYCTIMLPLLVAASLIEAYITPACMAFFM